MSTERTLRADVVRSLKAAWLVASGVALVILLASFVLSERQAARLVPRCEWQWKYHRPCAACGLTTGFLHAARGELAAAERANAATLPLFGIFTLNSMGAVIYISRRLSRTQRHMEE